MLIAEVYHNCQVSVVANRNAAMTSGLDRDSLVERWEISNIHEKHAFSADSIQLLDPVYHTWLFTRRVA